MIYGSIDDPSIFQIKIIKKRKNELKVCSKRGTRIRRIQIFRCLKWTNFNILSENIFFSFPLIVHYCFVINNNILSIIIIFVCLNESRILFYYFNIDIVLSFVANHIKINNFNKCFVRFKSYIISYFMKNNRNFIGVSIIEERKKKKKSGQQRICGVKIDFTRFTLLLQTFLEKRQ